MHGERPMQSHAPVGRRAAGRLLAAILALGVVAPAPALADEPEPTPTQIVTPSPEPSVEPSVEPIAEPSLEPSPTASSQPSPTAGPSTDPTTTISWPGGLDPTDRFIVVLEPGADVSAVVGRQRDRGIRTAGVFRTAIRGFAATLDRSQVAAVAADPEVEAVVPDEIVSVEAQGVPSGVSRVFGRSNGMVRIDGVDDQVDADIAIVDTGIATHPDLNVVGGLNCSTSNPAAWRDVHGHGTHVAGIAAARDDAEGLVGVAMGARLWAVKILNDSGFGFLSWYVCGLDWIASQRDPDDPERPLFEVANMSVAKDGSDDRACGSKNNDILHAAICRLVAAGVTVVAAAGNESRNATTMVPAAYNEVTTVSALADTDGRPGGLGGNRCYSFGSYDTDDTFANFSNYGGDVDLIAPGKCIMSTMPGGGFATMSGTSMATPHVSGAVALYKATRPWATPAQVRAALIELGNLGWRLSTDPDDLHEKLLDVSRIGPFGTFDLVVDNQRLVSTDGTTISIRIGIDRSPTFFERVDLQVTGPSGWTTTLEDSSLTGFDATSTELRLVRPAGAIGRHNITIVASHGPIVREALVGVVVAQPSSETGTPSGDSGGSGPGGAGATRRPITAAPASSSAGPTPASEVTAVVQGAIEDGSPRVTSRHVRVERTPSGESDDAAAPKADPFAVADILSSAGLRSGWCLIPRVL
jgi:subtilisin family serine protease